MTQRALLPSLSTLVTADSVKGLSVGILFFVYVVIALSYANITYSETVHRIPTTSFFNENIFGSNLADCVVAIGLFLLFLSLALGNRRAVVVASVGAFGATIILAIFLDSALQAIPIASLATVPAVVVMAALARSRMPSGIRMPKAGTVAIGFLLTAIVIEALALGRWVTYPAFPTPMYGDISWKYAKLESALYNSFAKLSPVLLVLIAFSFLFRNAILEIVRRRYVIQGTGFEPVENTEYDRRLPLRDSSSNLQNETISTGKRSEMLHWVLLCSALIIAPVIALYPHLSGVNPAGTGVSVDQRVYDDWLKQLRSLPNLGDQVAKSFTIQGGDRPLTLLFIKSVADLSQQSDVAVVRYLPVLLAPAFVACSYLLVRYGWSGRNGESKRFASIVAIIAAVSPTVVVGMYAGFLANWLAMGPALLSILLVVRTMDLARDFTGSPADLKRLALYAIALFATLSLTMLFHVYTWGYLIVASGLFALISFIAIRRFYHVRTTTILKVTLIIGAVIAASVVTDLTRSAYFATKSGLARDTIYSGSVLNLGNFATRWENVSNTTANYVGGFLANPIILMLALFWVFKMRFSGGLDRFLVGMMFLLAIPILFGTTEIQARLLYVVPLFITAVLSLGFLRQNNGPSKLFGIAVIALALSVAVYALRAMANLDLVLPPGFTMENDVLVP